MDCFLLLRRLPGLPAGAQDAVGGFMQKAQNQAKAAAQDAVAKAAAEEAKKQMSNAFSAGMGAIAGRKK